jgi:hypothetical protein
MSDRSYVIMKRRISCMTWENAPIAEATFWLHDSFRRGA